MAIISIDFFGNLNEDADFWQEFLGYVVEEGHKVHVISGPWPNEILSKLGFGGYKLDKHFHEYHSILQHLSSKGLDVWLDEEHDSWYSQEFPWWRAKAEICDMQNINIHFDNDRRFSHAFRHVPTRFVYTEDAASKEQLRKWYNALKLANTYEDWEEDYMYMTGFVPM